MLDKLYSAANIRHSHKHTDCCPQSPSDGRYNSSSYGDGQYHWLVPNPVEEGSYTCLIPSRYVHVLCLPPGISQGPEATLAVDNLKVRVMLMEAEQRSLKADNRQLSADNQQLKADSQQLKADNQQLKGDNQHLRADNRRFAQNILSLQQHVMQLEADRQQVTAFIQGKWKKHWPGVLSRARMHHKVVGNFGSEADVRSLYYRRFRFNETSDVGTCTHGRPAK